MSASHGTAMGMRRKAFSLGALRALVRLICSFVSIKLTAVYLGPSGLALIAQFNNFMTLCQNIVVSGLETATVRLTSEYGADAARRRVLLATVGKFGLALGLPTALLVAAASPWLSSWLLKDPGYAWVFVLGALGLLAAILNAVLLAALSARGDIAKAVGSNILATVCGLLVFAPAAMLWGITGGLYASSAIYLFSLLVTLILVSRSTLISVRDFVGRFDRAQARRIAGFYPMLIVHAVTVPLSLILIREHVTSSLSLEAAGLWQACWRLSETYLMVVMSSVTTQFMARLGEVVNFPDRLRAEVLRTLGAAVGATAALALGIFVFREWIVRLVFSPAFLPVADLIPMQLVGDLLKMMGWTLGFALVATVRSGWYITIEIVVPLVFILAARALGSGMGVSGVTMAYAIAGLVQCILAVVALRDVIFLRGQTHER
jgi:polysaccharide transporter, PST family